LLTLSLPVGRRRARSFRSHQEILASGHESVQYRMIMLPIEWLGWVGEGMFVAHEVGFEAP
jgi:hypothetical protein